jgi:hypothetical protein
MADTLRIKPVPLPASVKDSFSQKKRTKHVLVDPEHRIWDRTVITWKDGRYHAYYSRWTGAHPRWLTDSEVVHAVSDTPEGPYEDMGVVIANRNPDGWDIVDAHSQYAVVAEDKVLIYYQTDDLRGKFTPEGDSPFPSRAWLDDRKANRQTIRDSQRIGLAIGDDPAGPFTRSPRPVVTPDSSPRIKNITDNPAVVYHDGRYTLIFKSDAAGKKGAFRIQMVGHSARPDGPFHVGDKPVYDRKQTEDATAWFDTVSNRYYMACHVMGRHDIAMFTSTDGIDWEPAFQRTLMKKEFLLSDGKIWKPERVEQPRILTDENGTPVMICVAVADDDVNGNIAVPLMSYR